MKSVFASTTSLNTEQFPGQASIAALSVESVSSLGIIMSVIALITPPWTNTTLFSAVPLIRSTKAALQLIK